MALESAQARATLVVENDAANRILVVGTGTLGTALFDWKVKAQITSLFLCSRHANKKWVSIGVQNSVNIVHQLYQYGINGKDYEDISLSLNLEEGDYLVAWAEIANAIDLVVSGFQNLR